MATLEQVHQRIRENLDGREDRDEIMASVDQIFEAEAELQARGLTCLCDPVITGLLNFPPAHEGKLH